MDILYYGGFDVFLHQPANLLNAQNKPYLKFTPFYRFAKSKIRLNIIKLTSKELTKIKAISRNQNLQLLKKLQIPIIYKATRAEALNKLAHYPKHYLKTRDVPSIPTTQISAYLHYGIISPQEVYEKLPPVLQRQIIWREFYLYIAAFLHQDYSKKSRTLSRNIKWKNNKDHFKKWCDGKTGIPWIDAGMRELNATGFMHNRLRMNVAMFLIFYLQIDWRWGEKYFAQHLIDYDYAQNSGNWMWCASWESFSNPYFRIFSMEQQMHRFDPDAKYIKKWVPELKNIPAKDLYNWPISCDKYKVKYPKPIITDLNQARQNGIMLFKR
jgi:deoxyribodipyrimidine photo-lyase